MCYQVKNESLPEYDYTKYSKRACYIASKWCQPEIEQLANKMAINLNNQLYEKLLYIVKEYLIMLNEVQKEKFINQKNLFMLGCFLKKYLEQNDKINRKKEKIKKIKKECEILKHQNEVFFKKNQEIVQENYRLNKKIVALKEIKTKITLNIDTDTINTNKNTKIMIEKYNHDDFVLPDQKFWCGFNVNTDLKYLFNIADINSKYLKYNEADCINNKLLGEELFIILLRLCRITKSRQLLWFVNKYGDDTKKCNGKQKFKATFQKFFDVDDKFLLIESCNYINNISMKKVFCHKYNIDSLIVQRIGKIYKKNKK